MKQEEKNDSFFKTILWKILGFFWPSKLIKNFSWLISEKISLPENEVGKFMQRYLKQTSWFDTLSSNWAKQPFLIKLAVCLVITLPAALFGLPTLFACAGIFMGIHLLLALHNHQRIIGTELLAKDHIKLTNKLTSLQQDLEKEISVMQKINHDLLQSKDEVNTQANQLATHMTEVIKTIETTTTKVKKLHANLNKANDELEQHNSVLIETTKNMNDLGKASNEIGKTVKNIQELQEQQAQTVTNLNAFFHESQAQKSHRSARLKELYELEKKLEEKLQNLETPSL